MTTAHLLQRLSNTWKRLELPTYESPSPSNGTDASTAKKQRRTRTDSVSSKTKSTGTWGMSSKVSTDRITAPLRRTISAKPEESKRSGSAATTRSDAEAADRKRMVMASGVSRFFMALYCTISFASIAFLPSPLLAQGTVTHVKVYTVGTLPATCDPEGRPYVVTDGTDNADCTTGGGSTPAWCACDSAGTGYNAMAGAGGGGSGDVTDVGDCTTGACFTADGAGNSLVFEGSTADGFELTLTATDPGSDVTLTLPAATDTLVARDTTDTLTNKTINTASNTITVVEADISDLAHTTDTGPSPDCTGTDTYQDGEGNCDTVGGDVSGGLDALVVADDSHDHTDKLPLAGGTLTGEVTVDDLGLEFTPGDTLTDCSTYAATGGGIFYDDSEGKFKKCQDNTLTDLDTDTTGIGGSTGATDNAILRADGTGGSTVQNSRHSIADNGTVSLDTSASDGTADLLLADFSVCEVGGTNACIGTWSGDNNFYFAANGVRYLSTRQSPGAIVTGVGVSLHLGSTGAAVTWGADTDTYIDNPSADQLRLAAGGQEGILLSETSSVVTVTIDDKLASGKQSTTLGAAATTFATVSNFVVLTGDGGGNTLATITGGATGMVMRILFVDANVTITDDNTHAANSVDLGAAFTSADDTVLSLIYDGTSWYEIGRSVN